MKAINVGLLGIGTVGGGTFTVLKRNEEEITRRAGRPIRITTVADKNLELARRVAGEGVRLTDDAFSVVADPEIDIVVELIGGYGVAKDLVRRRSRTASTSSPPTRRCSRCTATRSLPPRSARASWSPSRPPWPAASRSSRRCAKG
jgi:hypothetical protein